MKKCARCGCNLNSYNKTSYCFACSEQTEDGLSSVLDTDAILPPAPPSWEEMHIKPLKRSKKK